MSLEAILYSPKDHRLSILDQRRIPHESIYIPISTVEDAFHAIRSMAVRGAPAIAIVAALGLAVDISNNEQPSDPTAFVASTKKKLLYLIESRPTAVNLSNMCLDIENLLKDENESNTTEDLKLKICQFAETLLEMDKNQNINIGNNGAKWISNEKNNIHSNNKFSVITICNTGSLATAGYGTALGIIRSLHNQEILNHVYALETRPYNQGSRLTAFELVHENIPSTLITDSMASHLLKEKKLNGEGIGYAIVGADRIAKNGDTANKIGTYQLAITAKYHGVKFIVAAPLSTIDLKTSSGKDIQIEQRPGIELTRVSGALVDDTTGDTVKKNGAVSIKTVHVSAPGINTWNPSFDVTPSELIDAIVTEVGVAIKNENGEFELDKLFR